MRGSASAGPPLLHRSPTDPRGPLMAGELVRAWQRRRLDLGIALALLLPCASLGFLLPLLSAASRYAASFWAHPAWAGPISFYRVLLEPAVSAALGVVVVVCAFATERQARSEPRTQIPLHEAVAISALAALPFGVILVAKLITGAFVARYSVSAVIGISVLFAWGMARVSSRRAANVAIGVMIVASLLMSARQARDAGRKRSYLANGQQSVLISPPFW